MKRFVGVGIVLSLVLAGCGSSGTRTVTVTSTASSASVSTSSSTAATSKTAAGIFTTTTTSTSSTPAVTVHVATFTSPSGNIGCMIVAGTARCDIKQRTWTAPRRPSSCPGIVDYGQGLIVTRSGAGHLVCAGDTTLDPSAKPLPYNARTLVGAMRCTSATNGMTCTNTRTGHGFFIAIQSYRTF